MKQTMMQKFLECMYQNARLNDLLFQRELTKGEFGVMEVVKARHQETGGCVSANELAAFMQCKPSAISRTLRGLEERGLVERTINRADRRGIHVALTKRGEALLGEEEKFQGNLFQNVMDRIGEEKLSVYLDIWKEMLTAYVESVSGPLEKG